MNEIDSSIIREVFKPRAAEAHKTDFGHLLVIGGSKLYSGSPALNALAAYRVGADLVTVVAPRRAADVVASFSPDLITYPVEGDYFTPERLNVISEFIQGKTAVVVGGGLGRRPETMEFVTGLLSQENLPIVIDADAIYAVVGQRHLLKEKKFLLTPHEAEFGVLTEEVLSDDFEERTEAVRRWAVELTSTIVLKGKVDVVSDGQQTSLNRTGNPFMTVGGTGDTLAGILGGLLAQGVEEFTAACAAVYLNGAAGDVAAAQKGPGMLAADLLDCLPQVIMDTLTS